ncbi:MAG: ATP-binding cassette domain-containing protein, partial [Pseudomonadales bacterium]|nr:ATP-binding cassette domain-containing protein [Pseudomonadales bacterium]
LKHRPLVARELEGAEATKRESEVAESRRAGNAVFDFGADWVDYASAGAEGSQNLSDRLLEILSLVDMRDNIYRFGLVGTIDPVELPDVAEGILKARTALLERLEEDDASDLVVRFDPEQYNRNASIAENLLFGTPTKPAYQIGSLTENKILQGVLAESGLDSAMLETGLSIARTMVEIFADLPAGHPFFDQFSFIDADDLPDYKIMVTRAENSGLEALAESDRQSLKALPYDYVEARHRLGLVDQPMEERLVAARKRFADRLSAEDPGAVEPYLPDQYNATASLQDNILFGRLAYGEVGAEEIVGAAVTDVLEKLDLRETVTKVGLDYEVGIGGKRLSSTQRQKLGLARAMLKNPDVLIINEATAVMDNVTQAKL